jgi:phosphopantothenoylcysteine synthetase/decarboxylase
MNPGNGTIGRILLTTEMAAFIICMCLATYRPLIAKAKLGIKELTSNRSRNSTVIEMEKRNNDSVCSATLADTVRRLETIVNATDETKASRRRSKNRDDELLNDVENEDDGTEEIEGHITEEREDDGESQAKRHPHSEVDSEERQQV